LKDSIVFSTLLENIEQKKKKKERLMNWIPLTTLDQLQEIKEQSKSETVLIFKHSTRCGISRAVINQFEKKVDDSVKTYYLDLLNYRDISNEIGYTFQVMHQSPQLLVIKNEQTVAHASHYEISRVDLEQYL